MRQNVIVVWLECLLVDVMSIVIDYLTKIINIVIFIIEQSKVYAQRGLLDTLSCIHTDTRSV